MLADKELKSEVKGRTRADLILENEQFLCKNVEFTLLGNLVKEIIIGLKGLNQPRSITLELEGKQKPLNFKPAKASHLSVMCSKVESVSYTHLTLPTKA